MKKINDANWMLYFHGFSLPFERITTRPAPDLECIQINNGLEHIAKYLYAPKHI